MSRTRTLAAATLLLAALSAPAVASGTGDAAPDDLPTSGEGATMGSTLPVEEPGSVTAFGRAPIDPVAELTHGPYGVDTSGHTTIEDWQWFTDHSAQFVWIKATEGTYLATDSFSDQWKGATEQGMLRGSYHFANPEVSSGRQQAEYFVAHRGGWSPDGRTLPGALDMEYNPYGPVCYGKSQAEMAAWARDFITRYEELTGVKPVVYTNAHWWNTCVGTADFSDVKLWLARYSSAPGIAPKSWSMHGATHTIWQAYPVDAHGYDVNRVHGDRADLERLARRG
ncbi:MULTISPECIES: GH25 family lysozyme [Kytococcus]|nr:MULTISPECIES: GH25 family lysozyme [Kytococcus]OFS07386.1 hypothetical protein HMPREF3099_10375 [Kytococcus sp. HMSC28H12]